jgi:hypothetical protein
MKNLGAQKIELFLSWFELLTLERKSKMTLTFIFVIFVRPTPFSFYPYAT